MMRVMLQPAFVLHTRLYGDTSLLVDFFSSNHGRIPAVARSARGLQSRFKGHLQPFSPLFISWSGKSELMQLTAVELNGTGYNFAGKTLFSAIYLNELLVRLLQRYDPFPNLFRFYEQALAKLQENESPQQALRFFEKRLLSELGYGLQLNKEAFTDAAIQPQHWYGFEPGCGLIRCQEQPSSSPNFLGKHLLAIHQDNFLDKETLQAAKQLMRLALGAVLGNTLIKSRELFVIAQHR
jgi:DNA repair protein RecO (recombination protein O)